MKGEKTRRVIDKSKGKKKRKVEVKSRDQTSTVA